MYPQGVCRIRKPAYAGNGCAIFPVFDTEEWAEKIRSQPQTIYSEVPKESSMESAISEGDSLRGSIAAYPYGSPKLYRL